MSTEQWAAMTHGDEFYGASNVVLTGFLALRLYSISSLACATSWFRFEERVKDLTGFQHIIPAHQGRAAEKILFQVNVLCCVFGDCGMGYASHDPPLAHTHQIRGNDVADQLAGRTSLVRTAATHDEFSYETQKALLRSIVTSW